jgi:hypothetical protein
MESWKLYWDLLYRRLEAGWTKAPADAPVESHKLLHETWNTKDVDEVEAAVSERMKLFRCTRSKYFDKYFNLALSGPEVKMSTPWGTMNTTTMI